MRSTKSVLFLCWGCPWPAFAGIHLRSIGLLKQISKEFDVELLVLNQEPLTNEQHSWLSQFSSHITWLPLKNFTIVNKLTVLGYMARYLIPYHPASVKYSLDCESKIKGRIKIFSGVIFTNLGHWGVLVEDKTAKNWILNQCDADVEFWKAYASQTDTWMSYAAANINWYLAARFFPKVYSHVARIISVCEADRQFTLNHAPSAVVEVIENGIDCDYYLPNRTVANEPPQILFTGTSAHRNVVALRSFAQDVLPLVQKEMGIVKLLVAGNFSAQAQSEFKDNQSIEFTGRVDDIRPFFDQSDVFISYFKEAHGSKLKIAEAMSMAIPIVSTPAGSRGFDLVNGESVLIGDSEVAFAKHIVTLLQNKELGRQIGLRAREIAIASIDWQFLGQRLNKIIDSLNNIDHPFITQDGMGEWNKSNE